MIKAFLTWGASSLRGHFAVSLVVVALPLFLRALIMSIRADYPTGDLGTLIILPVLEAFLLALFVWYFVTVPRMKRRAPRANQDAPRDPKQ